MTRRPVRRSGLTMPVNTARFVNKAWTRECDFINIDLEDSVPEWKKPEARTLVKDAIGTVSKGGAEVYVRINHGYVEEDLDAVVWPGLQRVNYPKTETAEEIRRVDETITRLERERGIRPGTIEIGANVESALGVTNAYEIASASPRIRDFGGGSGYDMTRDIGAEMFVGFDQFVYARGEQELAARALGKRVMGVPFVPDTRGSVSDPDLAFSQAEAARKCGLRYGSGLHPNVVAPQNRGFTPTPDEVELAGWVLERYRELEALGKAWEEVSGHVIDAYEARRATELLDWARLCAEKDRDKAEAVARTKVTEGLS